MKSTNGSYVHDDGGRAAAGYKGSAGDCVVRAVAIASGRPYAEVYAALAQGTGSQRAGKRGKRSASARDGINTGRKWFKEYMASLGFTWAPTMQIGSGCKVHLRKDELPTGQLVVAVSKHYTAVINGVIHDTHDPSREGTPLRLRILEGRSRCTPGRGGVFERLERRRDRSVRIFCRCQWLISRK